MKRPRTLAEAELRATMLGENVKASPEHRDGGIGWPEITFVGGALLFLAGIAIVSVPVALVVGGAGLCALVWKLA